MKSIWEKWAENTSPVRSGKHGNMSFHGMAAFSYDVIVAVKYPDPDGSGGTLVIADNGIFKSRTTTTHKNKYASAVPSCWKKVYVDMCMDSGSLCLIDPGLRLTTIEGLVNCHECMTKGVMKMLDEVDSNKAWNACVKAVAKLNALGAFLDLPAVNCAI